NLTDTAQSTKTKISSESIQQQGDQTPKKQSMTPLKKNQLSQNSDSNLQAPSLTEMAKLEKQLSREKPKGRQCYKLKPGFEENPLLKIPRNSRCPCQSGKKFKACCLVKIPTAVTTEQA